MKFKSVWAWTGCRPVKSPGLLQIHFNCKLLSFKQFHNEKHDPTRILREKKRRKYVKDIALTNHKVSCEFTDPPSNQDSPALYLQSKKVSYLFSSYGLLPTLLSTP